MTLFPVVERELRVAARRPGTFWGRTAAAAIGVGIGGWYFWTVSRLGGASSLGLELFQTVAVCIYAYAALAGVTYSSDSVTVEKREGTLGLLFLTSLRGYDVVIGKLTASSLGAFYRLLAVLPVMALSLLLGGVTPGEYWRMVAVLLNTLFASLAVGMFASTICANSRQAAVVAFAILAMVGAGAPLFLWGIQSFGGKSLPAWLATLTPVYSLIGAQDTEYQGTMRNVPLTAAAATAVALSNRVLFWMSFGLTSVIGGVSLVAASIWLPRSWQVGESPSPNSARRRWTERWRERGRAATGQLRSRLLDANPLLWLSARDEWKHLAVWIAMAAGGAIFLLLAWRNGRSWWDLGTYLITSILAHFALKFWMASEVPRRLLDDRRSGAMELYLCTPMPVAEILKGQFHALRRQFLGPVIAVLAIDFLFLLASDSQFDRERNSWLLFWLARMFFLVLDFLALGWVGMWIGMAGRGHRPTGGVIFRVLLIPWLASFALLTLVLTVNWLAEVGSAFTDPMVFLAAWFLIGLISDVSWISYCRRELQAQFRELATTRPGERRRGWLLQSKQLTAEVKE